MQLTPAQLSAHLTDHGLPAIMSVFGDTPLLIDDALQQIRRFAREQGIDERQRWLQDNQFDWQQLNDQSASLSLFSTLKLVELELPEGKPGREGGEALRNYAQAPTADQILIIIGPKLKQEQLKAKWYKELTAAGPVVTANSPERSALPRFIQQRAQLHQVQLQPDATQLLADWFEGNLLALDQELQKLALSDLPQPLSMADIQRAAEDQSRFNVFALQEAIVQADLDTALHRLARLFEDGVEEAILSWMLQREWQLVSTLKNADNYADACRKNGVWRNQEAAYRNFCQRMSPAAISKAAQLLARMEYAFKRDSGEHYTTLATHLVTLYCRPEAVGELPQ
ncbi:DNA polymerase III subunit delta [Pseudidiomarina gelatinasegens]|jgi:DNA polymerase-3 subunit delta|uniref:DNA polymerase III subunit delta n=1 Tax=Pseudidiomarina gelatinasegens TaxID=2487740 RepID=A0A443Z7A7_9GAMM|nr:DNA polymerase III subunit delta [Pseudidiomarina gelatinasegens]RWU12739.1 DNA polymerase III subunit delta [Pseudidiomarina gelatinasegens]